MRRFLAVAAWLVLAHAARGENFTVGIGETAVIEKAGATAAYTTNPDIADVIMIDPGRIMLTGHEPGTTQLVVISMAGLESFGITVPVSILPPTGALQAGVPRSEYDGFYSSGTGQLRNGIDVLEDNGSRRTEFQLININNLRSALGEAPDVIATIFYRINTPGREITFLDDMVNVSPLTIENTQVRGLHLKDGNFEFHAGYASSTFYDELFLPTARRWLAGAGYGIDFLSTRWTPSVYGFFSQPDGTPARRGFVGALTAEHRDGDTFYVRADVGVSRSIATSGEVRYFTPRNQLHADFIVRPDNFPTVGLTELAGRHAELDWSSRLTKRLLMTSYGSYDRFSLSNERETIGVASVGLRYALTRQLAVLTGGDLSEVRTPLVSDRTVGLPVGLAYDTPSFGLAATYRFIDDSESPRRGDEIRLDAHAGSGSLTANVWADQQRRAPSLSLIFNDEPGLEQALINLGITVRTPEDLAQALRNNPALINLGFISGVNVELSPKQLQTGFNFGWRASADGRNSLHLLAIYNQDEEIGGTEDTLLATLSYTRRLFRATDIYVAYSWWRSGLSSQQENGSSVDVGLRQQFDGLPGFLERSGTIKGFAFLDPDMKGERGPGTQPLSDIAVTLDGRPTRTDRAGAYSFEHVAPGVHRVAAQLPASPRAFFTTPSYSEVKGSAHVDFGVVWAASRIDGRVISDAGGGIPNVVLSSSPQNGQPTSTTSDSDGRFTFAVMSGTFRVALAKESLPDGYELSGLPALDIAVETDKPQVVAFEVRALRSISGRVVGASEARIESLGRTAAVDAKGNFVFRGLPSGTFTITASSGGRDVGSTVTLPPGPTLVKDIALEAAPRAVASIPTPRPAAVVVIKTPAPAPRQAAPPPVLLAPSQERGAFRVQVGAFRQPGNAAAARQRIEELGEHAEISQSGSLELVTIGPFATRRAAEAEVAQLKRENIDAVVRTDQGMLAVVPLSQMVPAPEPPSLPVAAAVKPVAAPPVPRQANIVYAPAPVPVPLPPSAARPVEVTQAPPSHVTTEIPVIFAIVPVPTSSPAAPPPIAVPAALPAPGAAQPSTTAAHVLYAGAFPDDRSAEQLRSRLQRTGAQVFTAADRDKTVVYVGPFGTRQEAEAACERLRRTGFDTFVTQR